MVALTGDVSTGREVARTASDTLKLVHLELGGKAPVIVFADADIDAVVETIKLMGYWNSGQECGAACRVIASSRIHDRLLDQLASAVASIEWRDPGEADDIDMGPVVTKEQQERVYGFVERSAVTALVGGTIDRPRGWRWRDYGGPQRCREAPCYPSSHS